MGSEMCIRDRVKGGNRLTLLRDADGDGKYELKTVFAEDLNAPYGLAFANGRIYVANQDALVSFPYQDGQTQAGGAPDKLVDLPAAINHHWTKSLAASADGRYLYVGIGSNSNVGERGMDVEVDRAVIWEIDAQSGAHKNYATGEFDHFAVHDVGQTEDPHDTVGHADDGAFVAGLRGHVEFLDATLDDFTNFGRIELLHATAPSNSRFQRFGQLRELAANGAIDYQVAGADYHTTDQARILGCI